MAISGRTKTTITGKAICEAVWLEQGEIILVRFPFSNAVDYKIRPALVVSNSGFNRNFDVWICPITSKKTAQCIALNNHLAEGKLELESFAKTSAIAVMEKEMVLKKIGRLSSEKTGEIIRHIIRNSLDDA